MKMIDLRSDTVTQPTDEMRRAMACAVVGDDVYGDDPTMNELEALAAQMLGKEAAMFVPSGTMGNQVSIMTHVSRGGEVILSDEAHIMAHEVGAAAALSGAFMRPLHYPDELPEVDMIRRAIREKGNIHYPETQLICLENPLSAGRVVPLARLRAVYALAQEQGVKVHLDGARIFNAATALGVPASEIAACADSVMACLSKGLCAPVGSIVAGTRAFIDRARKNRKMMGGGMRQAGFLAAAGIVALRDMTGRVGEDHENARYMAGQLQKMPGVKLNLDKVEINMVFFAVEKSARWIDALPGRMLAAGVKINALEDGLFRYVTTNDVRRADVDYVLQKMAEFLTLED
ncbi:MAG: GntG family PLP-dependent aldolase [Clostridia bacterium]